MYRGLGSILFDFDYTLADSSQGAIECVGYALENMGLPDVPAEHICRTVGLSLPATLEALTAGKASDRAEEFERLFMYRAEQVMADRTVLFPTVEPTLQILKERRFRLGIVSTKTRRRIVSILQREGLDGFFEAIVGGGDVRVHKPDPTGLLLAAGRLGGCASETMYVGDSVTDAETAQLGGMGFGRGWLCQSFINRGQVVVFFIEHPEDLSHIDTDTIYSNTLYLLDRAEWDPSLLQTDDVLVRVQEAVASPSGVGERESWGAVKGRLR